MVLLCLSCGRPSPQKPERIVLVSIDTLRADHLGSYGNKEAKTPHLDRLAAEGIRFTKAFSPAPLTLPSHSTLMTGMDPPEHGVRHNSVFRLDPSIDTLAERFRKGGYATAAFVAAFVLDSKFGLDQGFDHYDDQMAPRRPSSGILGYAERQADQVVDAALPWIDEAPDRFFLWLHFYDPHAGYDPPPGFMFAFSANPYAGEIAFVDFQLGRVLAKLEERWPAGGTAIAVTSDHGESLGEHGELTHSYTIHDATQRIPIILFGDAIPKGEIVNSVVSLKDVAPTLLKLAELPALSAGSGRNLLSDPSNHLNNVAYSETLATQLDMGWSPLFSLRDADYRYIRAPSRELYDFRTDPAEENNLVELQPDQIERFETALDRILAAQRFARSGSELGDDEYLRLEALGYVIPQGPADFDGLGIVGGTNPKAELRIAEVVYDASNFIMDGKHKDALALLQPLENPGSMGFLLLSEAARNMGEFSIARNAALEVVRLKPRLPAGWVQLARVYEQAQEWENARKAWQDLLRLESDSVDALLGLGRVAEQQKMLEEAYALYAQARRVGSNAPQAYWREAASRTRGGDFETAESLLSSMPSEGWEDPLALLHLIKAERSQGRFVQGTAHLRRGIDQGVDDALVWMNYARELHRGGRNEEASVARKRAMGLESDHPVTLNELAWLLYQQGVELPQALTMARRAAELAPGEPVILDTLATLELEAGSSEGALKAVDRGLREGRRALQGRFEWLRARALQQLGRLSEARRSVLRGLSGWRVCPRARYLGT